MAQSLKVTPQLLDKIYQKVELNCETINGIRIIPNHKLRRIVSHAKDFEHRQFGFGKQNQVTIIKHLKQNDFISYATRRTVVLLRKTE